MATIEIQKSTLLFLKNLSKNNNRDWFTENKVYFTKAHNNMCDFVDSLIVEMNKHDTIENPSGKKSLYRIYNDVRFSKDKSPYNPRFAFSLQRSTKHLRGGYYLNIKPGNCFLACGFFAPNSDDLKRIRLDIASNHDAWQKIVRNKNIKNNFGELKGNKLLTTPKGFPKEHLAIDLLRHKQFIFRHEFKDTEIVSKEFLKIVNSLFKSIRPYFDYMSEVLTTNVNGESIV